MNKTDIKLVGLVAKPHPPRAAELLREIIKLLERRGCEIKADEQTARLLGGTLGEVSRDLLMERCDLVVVLGGDGTLLSLAKHQGERQVPILGVNMGSLGFLTEISDGEALEQLEATLDGEMRRSNRMMLKVELHRGDTVRKLPHVLNDVVINKSALARIFDVNVILDGVEITTIRADGIIVSTPTGSTAYNLAANGPIIYPEMEVIVLSPICPFTLTNRPIVLPADMVVELRINGDQETFLTLDGQHGFPLSGGDIVRIERGERTLCILSPKGRSYFEVLQSKLKWGEH